MTTTASSQDTAAIAVSTGPLTVPLEIIRAAGARHRDAVNDGAFTLPGWVLLAATAAAFGLIGFAVLAWRDAGSPLLIACAVLGLAAAYTPDVLAALPASEAPTAD